jgi:hypothetical protein
MCHYLKKTIFLNLIILLGSIISVIPAQANDVTVHISNRTKANLSVNLYKCVEDSCTSPVGSFRGRTSDDYNVKPDFLRAFSFTKQEGSNYELLASNRSKTVQCPKITTQTSDVYYDIIEKRPLSTGFKKVIVCKLKQ